VPALETLFAAATERFGAPVTLEPAFRPALEALCLALQQEARLSSSGATRAHEQLSNILVRRAELAAAEQRGSVHTDRPVEAPIVITGLPRTGTTLLHNLLARVDGLWAPPLWQLHAPVRPEHAGAEWAEQRREHTAATLNRLYTAAPNFRAIHPMEPDWPDQCNWLLRKSFSTLANAFAWFVPSYVQHLATCDMRPAYADHRRWLSVLLEAHERETGERARPALKDPFHMWHLDALLDVYPDATIIQLHREPTQVVPSFASLCATLQSVDTDSPRRPAEIGHFCLFILGHGLRALERARTQLPAERFIDLSYRELIASPGATLVKLGNRLGFDARGVAVEGAGRWLEDNRALGPGKHAYSLDDFGLTGADIDDYFDAYRRRFGPLLG
jgi:hypothetical protein